MFVFARQVLRRCGWEEWLLRATAWPLLLNKETRVASPSGSGRAPNAESNTDSPFVT